MNGRALAAAGLLVALVALAGCASMFGTGQPDPAQLAENASYDWDTNATTTFNVSRSSYAAVVGVENRSSVVVYQRDEVGTDQPIPLRGLKFRYPNGTVINATAESLNARNEGQRTNVTLPQEQGQVAFSASRPNAKRFSTPVFVEGSHQVILPARARVGIPLLSQVSPPGYDTEVAGDRMRITWNEVQRGPIVTRYYLQRDILIFGALGSVLAIAGIGGALYYVRQIRVLKRKREEIGLDVDTGDDDFGDDGPPPGMR